MKVEKSYNDKERYMIMKHQLEFFYLIPVDQIVDSIINEGINKNMEPSALLELTFKHCFEGASYYYDFIHPNMNHPFFNENPGEKQRVGLCRLIYLALQNNCILDSFFDELAFKSDMFCISAKNEHLAEENIMKLILDSESKNPLKGAADSQFFNNRKRIYREEQGEDIYINKILESLNIDNVTDLPIKTLKYTSPVAYFLFTEDICFKFGRSLNNSHNILDKYVTLAKKYQERKSKYTSSVDKIIFEAEMNTIFDFHFFTSIFTKVKNIHELPISKEKSLKDLEGQLFTNIILQIANLPLFFNKMLFYQYISYAFLGSTSIVSSYFDETAKDVMAMIPTPPPKALQTTNSLELMRLFFLILSSVVFPLLSSLWKTIINELIKKGHLSPDIITIYEEYIKTNFDSITYDYSNFTDREITEWGSSCYIIGENFNSQFLQNKINTSPDSYKSTTTKEYSFAYDKSSYTREIMEQLLISYCKIDLLKEERFPSFFLKKEELSAYSPLSKLITSLQYNQKLYRNREYYSETNFLIRYRKDLFEYLSSRK